MFPELNPERGPSGRTWLRPPEFRFPKHRKSTLIVEGDNIEIKSAPMNELLKQWRYGGCEVDEAKIEVRVHVMPNKKLVELPSGHVVPI